VPIAIPLTSIGGEVAMPMTTMPTSNAPAKGCISCNTPLSAGEHFCPECGARQECGAV
jgi:hypothetical protein